MVVDASSSRQWLVLANQGLFVSELDQEASIIPCIVSLFLNRHVLVFSFPFRRRRQTKEQSGTTTQSVFLFFPKGFRDPASLPVVFISRLCSFVLCTSLPYLGTQLCSFRIQRLMMNGTSLVAACVCSFSDEDWGLVAWITRDSGSFSDGSKSMNHDPPLRFYSFHECYPHGVLRQIVIRLISWRK